MVANRLPVDRIEMPDGSTAWRRSPGGLVTALAPVMQRPPRGLDRLDRERRTRRWIPSTTTACTWSR